MAATLALFALSALVGTGESPGVRSPTAATAVAATTASEEAAVAAARDFLAMLDRDDWTASWHATHTSFKSLNTLEWWSKTSQAVRGTAGTALSRELATVNFTAAPPKGYWVITFTAHYSQAATVTETVELASEGDSWKVAGVSIE